MNGLPTSWKIYRVCCIIYMVLVALQLMFSVVSIFYRRQILFPISESLVYGVIFFFVYMALSLLNYNYPDTPLTAKQRRQFNWLFLVNILFVAYLFGQLITEWRRVIPWITLLQGSRYNYLTIVGMLMVTILIFFLHLVFIGGMYQLRRVIYNNTMNSWYKQFDEEKK